jgi:hypothetical protein
MTTKQDVYDRVETIDPHALHHKLVQRGEEWADKNAAAEILEKTEKTVLSEVANDLVNGLGESNAAAERLARTSQKYRDHLDKMVEARRIANRAKVAYDTARTFTELVRTLHVTRREEAKAVGIT